MATQQLKQLLGKGFSIAAAVGFIVGLGIMRTPGEIAITVSNPVVYMSLWVIGGLFTLLTVLTAAELFAMTPKSGGVYALVRKAYGPYPGFVLGWTDVMALCASGALKSVVLAEYLTLLYPALAPHVVPIAIANTSFFALLQLAGLKIESRIQRTASVGFGLIMIALTIALFYGYLHWGAASSTVAQTVAIESTIFAKWGLVITAVVFTYDGWFGPTYFSGEMTTGARAVAEGAIRGVLIVMAFYLALNFALVLAVPLDSLVGHDLALSGAIEIIYGKGAGVAVILAAIFILMSHQNLQYMTVSRTLYALSVDGLGAERAKTVSVVGTPTGAVLFEWVFIVGLIFAGGFTLLISLTTFLLMFNYLGVLVGVFRMRKREPDADRPFKAWGYPWVSGVVVACWVGIIAFVGFTKPQSVVYGALLVAISAPLYLWLKRVHHLDEAAQGNPGDNSRE